MRQRSLLDKCIATIDTGLKSLCLDTVVENITFPASPNLTERQAKEAARLMRINHAGEIAAQGLYQGQALTAKLPGTQVQMQHAAKEEAAHLAWCAMRIRELGSHTSYLGALWYFGSVAIGALAGVAGDQWSLGFVAETEKQVMAHLDSHLDKLSSRDIRSRAIVNKMREEEAEHARWAIEAGAKSLPPFIQGTMKITAKFMTTTAYYV